MSPLSVSLFSSKTASMSRRTRRRSSHRERRLGSTIKVRADRGRRGSNGDDGGRTGTLRSPLQANHIIEANLLVYFLAMGMKLDIYPCPRTNGDGRGGRVRTGDLNHHLSLTPPLHLDLVFNNNNIPYRSVNRTKIVCTHTERPSTLWPSC